MNTFSYAILIFTDMDLLNLMEHYQSHAYGEIEIVNICFQSLGVMDISRGNETSTATINKQKTFTLLRWKWKTYVLHNMQGCKIRYR